MNKTNPQPGPDPIGRRPREDETPIGQVRHSVVVRPLADRADYTATLRRRIEDLSEELSTLFRQYLELTKEELKRDLKELVEASAWAALSLTLIAGGGLALLAAAVLGLALVMPAWAASLLVGVVVISLGLVVGVVANHEAKDVDGLPDETARELKRTERALEAES